MGLSADVRDFGAIRGAMEQTRNQFGPFDIVVGGDYIYESLSFSVDGLTQLGLVPGLNAAFPFGGFRRGTVASTSP